MSATAAAAVAEPWQLDEEVGSSCGNSFHALFNIEYPGVLFSSGPTIGGGDTAARGAELKNFYLDVVLARSLPFSRHFFA